MKLSAEDLAGIRSHILRKLAIHNVWGAKHTSLDELHKGLPQHLRGAAKDVAGALIKEGLLLSHPTSYGLQVSLNPRRADDIRAALGVK